MIKRLLKRLFPISYGLHHEWQYEHPEKRRCLTCSLEQHVYYSGMDGTRLGWVNDNIDTYGGDSTASFPCDDQVLRYHLKASEEERMARADYWDKMAQRERRGEPA